MTASANRNVNVYGLCEVDVSYNGTDFNELGTTRDGVGFTSNGFFTDVHNDENGGDSGPPVEVQFMGETAQIRCELTKYDAVVATALEDHVYKSGATAGSAQPAGTLMFANTAGTNQVYTGLAGGLQIKLKCASVNGGAVVRTYTLCLIRDAIEFNRGTKFSTYVLTFTCYKDPANSNRLWSEASS